VQVAFFIINDFWFHPTEGSLGHLVGFFYDFLLLWEMSMIFNRRHKEFFWTFFLESFVFVHATLIAWSSIRFEATGHYPLTVTYISQLFVNLNFLVYVWNCHCGCGHQHAHIEPWSLCIRWCDFGAYWKHFGGLSSL
jgi:hypothetical protein